ncbi:hypothetical protein ACLMJK_003024 [Lecanora helva]
MSFKGQRSSVQSINLLRSLRKIACSSSFRTTGLGVAFFPASPYFQQLSQFPRGRQSSFTSGKALLSKHTDGFQYGQSGLPTDLEVLIYSNHKPREEEWAEAIDAYLPPNLRRGVDSAVKEDPVSAPPQSIESLPRILAEARGQSKIDLLSYMGVQQGRWEAVIWLVKAMMELYTTCGKPSSRSMHMEDMLWPSDGQSLDDLTFKAIDVQSPGVSRISLQSIMSTNEKSEGVSAISWESRCLGQIWQSLGSMILQAADRSPEGSQYSLIMTQVFRVLGHLHRINAFPNSIYNYTPSTDPTVLERPPTLYLLSKRIMSTLSDVEFTLQWKEVVREYRQQGYEVSDAYVAPKIREFGPELWLDLVLWACVEGGWIAEGADIISQMEKRKANRETQWSCISWQEICAVKAPQLDLGSIIKLQIDKTYLNQIGSLGMATGSDSTVDMGTRTISREVVLAIMDGLLNTAHSHHGASFNTLQQSLSSCKYLLEQKQPRLVNNLFNAVILRVIEDMSVNEGNPPGLLQRILDLRSKAVKSTTSSESLPSAQNNETDDNAAFLGLLHRNLRMFAEEANLQGSFTTLTKILSVVDSKRQQYIEDFARQLKEYAIQSSKEEIASKSGNAESITALSPQIPVSTLAVFLDLATESKFYDLGRWLLQNDDVDGGILDPKLYSDPNLQPALLRFATATADESLLTKTLAWIESPVPEPVLHALLRCQIALAKWTAVRELFQYFRNTPDMSWKASDAMALARAIMQLGCGPESPERAEQLSEAQNLLSDLLDGKYNSPRDPSELPDLSQQRLANQLSRIFKSLPGSLGGIAVGSRNANHRANASVSITPNAFNIILETLVDCYGPSAGKKLWERWCRSPGESPPKSNPNISFVDGSSTYSAAESAVEAEKVVTPTQYMLRNILRSILRIRQRPRPPSNNATVTNDEPLRTFKNSTTQEARARNQGSEKRPLTPEEQNILNWGIQMFRKFGLSIDQINDEIPHAIPKRTTPKDMVASWRREEEKLGKGI